MGENRANTPSSLRRQFLKIVLLSTLPLFVLVSVSNFAFLLSSRKILERYVEQSTDSLHNTIRIQMENSIRAYLRSKVEVALDLLKHTPDTPEGIQSVVNLLMDITVGDTGYLYALDSAGTVQFHPDAAIVQVDLSDQSPVTEQIAARTGYLEYDWQNTDESEPQAKALYMEYYPALDWIVTATSYRREFSTMVDTESIQQIVAQSLFGTTGYSYIFDREGRIVAHPHYKDVAEIETVMGLDEYMTFVDRLFETQEGYVTYHWRTLPDDTKREKVVYLKYLPDFDWIVGTAVYRSEMSRPILLLVVLDIIVALALGGFLGLLIFRINGSISGQIRRISESLEEGRQGNLSVRIRETGPQELLAISRQVNYFFDSLQEKTAELEELNSTLEERVNQRTKELTKASRKLIEAERDALTSRLVAGVAHELSNPVGLAITSVSYIDSSLRDLLPVLEQKKLTDRSELESSLADVREAGDIALRNLKRASGLLQSFKTVSSDQLSLKRRLFRIDEVVSDILLTLKPLLKNKHVTVDVDVPELELDTYPGVFNHMLVNLISNSLTHGFHGRDAGRISIQGRREGNDVVIEYQDDGIGIDPEIRQTLFDAFITTKRSDGSTGLGLNIVRDLVQDKLGGTINVTSEPRVFTAFTVRFPFHLSDS